MAGDWFNPALLALWHTICTTELVPPFNKGAGVSYRVSQSLAATEGEVQQDLPGPGSSPWLREVLQEREGPGGSPPSLQLGWCSSPEERVP